MEPKTKTCKCGNEFIPQYRNLILISKQCIACRCKNELDKRHALKRIALKTPHLPIKSVVRENRTCDVKKKVRRISEKGLIAKLDKVFSLFIRQRDSKDGVFKCISCGKPKPYRLADNGHYINRANMTTRYDEVNCNAQCSYCNRFREGNAQGYRKGLIKKYGELAVDILEMKKHNTSKISSVELQILIDVYKAKLKGYE